MLKVAIFQGLFCLFEGVIISQGLFHLLEGVFLKFTITSGCLEGLLKDIICLGLFSLLEEGCHLPGF